MDVTLFFFTLPQISKPLFFSPFSAMPLPQLLQFFFPISAMALPQLVFHKSFFFFFLYFDNAIATISLSQIFYFLISAMALPQLVFGQQVWTAGISVMWLPKFIIFSLPLFLFLSHTFIEFRQHRCRNSLSFLVLPKFTLFPQFPK